MKKKILFGIGLTLLNSLATYAGTMGDLSTYPAGFVLGGDVGYGYLSTQETELSYPIINDSLEYQSLNHRIGGIVWGVHTGYDFSILARLLGGFEVGYKNLGKSTYALSSHQYMNIIEHQGDVASQRLITTHQNISVNEQAIDFLLTGRFYVW